MKGEKNNMTAEKTSRSAVFYALRLEKKGTFIRAQ